MTIFMLLIGLIFATSVNSEQNIRFTNKTKTHCNIHDLYIDPCSDYSNKICKIAQGDSATIKFNYTLEFYATEPKIKIYGMTTGGKGPFSFIEDNSLQHKKWPIFAKQKNIFISSLYVMEKYPKGTYNVVVQLSGRRKAEDVCEFIFNLEFI